MQQTASTRYLLVQMIRRDIAGRYRGSLLGIVWAFATPLLLLAVYSFVFSVVFKSRWNQPNLNNEAFALVLFSGLILHNFLAESLSRATGILVQQANFVKKVIFPLWILPIVPVGTALFHAVISYAILLLGMLALGITLHPSLVMLPLLWLPYLLFVAGLCWVAASVGVFVRDLQALIALILPVLMFLSPIFYPLDALPEPYRGLVELNPLTWMIEATRHMLFASPFHRWFGFMVFSATSIIAAMGGLLWFRRLERGFADVL